MNNKESEKGITIKIKSKTGGKVKAIANKEGRKLNGYVEEALRGYLDGNKKD